MYFDLTKTVKIITKQYMRDNKFLSVLAFSMLFTSMIVTTSYASSNDTTNSYQAPQTPSFETTKPQEIIFKTPETLKNDSSKLEYKATIALPENNSWSLQAQQEASSQFSPKVIKKDDSNFLQVLSTNQFPAQTMRVVIDKIDLVDIDSRFFRIPNFRTEATNDYVYLPKSTTQITYKPTAEEIKAYDPNNTSTVYIENQDGKFLTSNPQEKEYQVAIIQEKVGLNDWAFAKPLQLNLTASTPENLVEADNIVKSSNFDNQNSQLVAPVATVAGSQETPSTNPDVIGNKQPIVSAVNQTGNGFNILPYIATLAGFGILNYGIRQYFKKD